MFVIIIIFYLSDTFDISPLNSVDIEGTENRALAGWNKMWKDIKMRLDSTSVLINMASRKLFQDMIDSDKYPTSGIEYKQLNSGVSLKHLFSFLWLNIWLSLND